MGGSCASRASCARQNLALEAAGRTILGDIESMGKGIGPEGIWDTLALCFAQAGGAVVEGAVARESDFGFKSPPGQLSW